MEYSNPHILTIWKFFLKRTEMHQRNDWLKLCTSVVNQCFRIRTRIMVMLWMCLYYLLRMTPFPFQSPGTQRSLLQLLFHTVAVLWNKSKVSLAAGKHRILYVRVFLTYGSFLQALQSFSDVAFYLQLPYQSTCNSGITCQMAAS